MCTRTVGIRPSIILQDGTHVTFSTTVLLYSLWSFLYYYSSLISYSWLSCVTTVLFVFIVIFPVLLQVFNPPPRSHLIGDYRNCIRLSVCPSVRLSVRLSFCNTFLSSISPEPFESFLWNFGQMFASVSRCAEPISQPCQLKVKVTGQGHGFEPWISCLLQISYTPGRIFFKLWSYVCLSEMMCWTHNSTMPTQGQGHIWISCPLCITYTSGRIFFKLWSSVHLSETMCRINNSTMPTQGQGHSLGSCWILCPLDIFFTPGRIFF